MPSFGFNKVGRAGSQQGIDQQSGAGRIGNRTVRQASSESPKLDKIQGTPPPKGNLFQRMFDSKKTQLTRTQRSTHEHAGKIIKSLQREPGQRLDMKVMLSEMKSMRLHFARTEKLSGSQLDPVSGLQMSLAGHLGGVSNGQLMSAHSTFLSNDMTQLRSALEAEIRDNPGNVDAKHFLEDLGVIEATMLMEISARVARGRGDQTIAPLQERLAPRVGNMPGKTALVANRIVTTGTYQNRELSDRNLELLVGTGGRSAAQFDKQQTGVLDRLQRKDFQMSPKQVGDAMRNADLTVNFSLQDFFGVGFETKPIDELAGMRNKFQWGVQPDANPEAMRRDFTERQFFESHLQGNLDPDSRPYYGGLNVGRSTSGSAESYGSSFFVLKSHVKQRSTYTVDDTFNVAQCKVPDDLDKLVAFEQDLGQLLPRLSDEGREYLQASNSEQINNLTQYLLNNPEFSTLGLEEFISKAIGDGHPLTKDDIDFVAAMVQKHFVDLEATRSQVANYDNVENLLQHIGDERMDRMMQAVESPSKGNFRIGNYIEAQIHGPISFADDVQALRVSQDEIDAVVQQAGISEEEALRKLETFCKKNDIELEIYDPNDLELLEDITENQEQAEIYHEQHMDPEIRSAQQLETQEATNTLFNPEHTGDDAFASILTSVGGRKNFDTTQLNESNVGQLRSQIVKAITQRSNNGTNRVESSEIGVIAENTIDRFIQNKLDMLQTIDDTGHLTNEQKEQFKSFVLGSSTLRDSQMLSAIVDSSEVAAKTMTLLTQSDVRETPNMLTALLGLSRSVASGLEKSFPNKTPDRDDWSLFADRSLSLGSTLSGLTNGQAQELYGFLSSSEVANLVDSLQINSGNEAGERRNLADMIAMMAWKVGGLIDKSMNDVDQDMQHVVTVRAEQDIPQQIRQDLESIGLI